jgi:hypothetical protein
MRIKNLLIIKLYKDNFNDFILNSFDQTNFFSLQWNVDGRYEWYDKDYDEIM